MWSPLIPLRGTLLLASRDYSPIPFLAFSDTLWREVGERQYKLRKIEVLAPHSNFVFEEGPQFFLWCLAGVEPVLIKSFVSCSAASFLVLWL